MNDMQKANRPALLPSALERLLPPEVTDAVQACGAPSAEEIRLHANRFCSVKSRGTTYPTRLLLSKNRLQEILHMLCRGSLYAYAETLRQGYLSPCCGVRVGVCGRAATEEGKIIGVGEVNSLIVRIPHPVQVNATPISRLLLAKDGGGMLIYAPPGIGKTTLLRALAHESASPKNQRHTVVVDTREELCYGLEDEGLHLSILSAYPRKTGIEIAVRSLGADLIVCDEIGNDEEIDAILSASNCGVPLLASAHASSLQTLFSKNAFKKLHRSGVFRHYVGLERIQNEFRFAIATYAQADKLLIETEKIP